MTGDTNVNTVISQGNAIKEIFNVKKQNFEMQQQTGMQERIKKHREQRIKIQESEKNTKIQVKSDENRNGRRDSLKKKEKKKEEQNQAAEKRSGGGFIDIIV